MSIQFACTCGKKLHAPDTAAGRQARCPSCAAVVKIPPIQPAVAIPSVARAPAPSDNLYEIREPPPRPTSPVAPRPVAAASTPPSLTLRSPVLTTTSRIKGYFYLLLILALLPLTISTFQKHEELKDVVERSVLAHPEAIQKIQQIKPADEDGDVDIDDILNALPDNKVDGALLSRHSHLHWLMAIGSAGVFFGAFLLFFPQARRSLPALALTMLFTATCGIVMLLVFQFIAFHMQGMIFTHISVITIFLYIAEFIGFSYRCALDPSNGFVLSFFGFTCGVGLCEEITKALPLLRLIKDNTREASWDEMLVTGMASGIGFGVAEGIMYAGQYNGIETADIYFVRFFSCVLLHAVWAGAVGVTMFNHQGWIHNAENFWMALLMMVGIVLVPMTLHGLYDTCLKQNLDAWGLVVAIASFGWLVFQIERMRRRPLDTRLVAA